MIKTTVKPWEEIVVHEIIKHNLESLTRLRIVLLRSGQTAMPLLWAEGVVFSRDVMPPTDDVIREQLKGVIHVSAVEWAPMPQYRKFIVAGGVRIPILDVSNTEALREMIKQIKKL